ncbi:dihydrolipoyl dehydrogenase [Brevibacillus ruminantium]|uniref:Dihydrolipoyl dehydrogenase n=1 Tax=Brevibacillus ruminantium TaxID=2950604 RepID=A0ABY4WEV3_9BACL|nr:dihydrolipoyl dehydrogenase [Brevibacillus ruminantium]USG65602.1 dihydrolipoyl dehydrogenase [Brevibacillus ruminantium]
MKKRLIVIGGGPGGYTAALRASQLGAEVTLIEKGELGGTCLNVGCIPTKSLLESSQVWAKSRQWYPEATAREVPWSSILKRKELAVSQLRKGVQGLLRAGKIKVIKGTASLAGGKTVTVAGEEALSLQADAIILATGSRPSLPPIEGMNLPGVVTSDELLSIQSLPKRLAIIGGGVIGVELATVCSELGVSVHVIEAADRILPNMDTQISQQLKDHLEKQKVVFSLGKKLEKILEKGGGSLELSLSGGESVEADLVLVAVGRAAVLEPLQLERAGVEVVRGKVKVNAYQQTNQPGIYAIGDCASPIMLAHVAMAEGKIAAEHALGLAVEPLNYDLVPQGIYSHPEAAMVGLTSEEARNRGFDIEEGIFPLMASGKALVSGETTGFLKVIADKKYGRLLGIHLLAPHATEMISEASLGLTLEATIDEIIKTVYPHPTIAEGIQEAALAIKGQAIHLP